VVIHRSTTRLDDENILASNRIFDFTARLANRELTQNAIAHGQAKYVADVFGQNRVGVPAKNDNIADHVGGCLPKQSVEANIMREINDLAWIR
jgi:hypothetical protein